MRKIIIISICVFFITEVRSQEIKKDTINVSISKVSDSLLYYKIKERGILFPEIVFAQALLESAHFKSNIFVSNNNLFGMRLPRVRKTTAIGKRRGYAVYDNWMLSVNDYKLWQNSIPKKYLKNKTTYYLYLQKVYCECKYYSSRLKKIINYRREHGQIQ